MSFTARFGTELTTERDPTWEEDPPLSVEELPSAKPGPIEESEPSSRILDLLNKYYPIQYEHWMRRLGKK